MEIKSDFTNEIALTLFQHFSFLFFDDLTDNKNKRNDEKSPKLFVESIIVYYFIYSVSVSLAFNYHDVTLVLVQMDDHCD